MVVCCFLATFTAYVERVGFSIAFTAMSKQSQLDEHVKGNVLSAFYWGYGVSQVSQPDPQHTHSCVLKQQETETTAVASVWPVLGLASHVDFSVTGCAQAAGVRQTRGSAHWSAVCPESGPEGWLDQQLLLLPSTSAAPAHRPTTFSGR
jgi:hypothetical protein